MTVGIIGYGSMGKMLADKFAASGLADIKQVCVANRSKEKLATVSNGVSVCNNNAEVAGKSDLIFLCVRPVDLKNVLQEIDPYIAKNALVVSLNGSVSFQTLEGITNRKIAKVIPSVTAEIDRSQTLVCYNASVTEEDKVRLKTLLGSIGNVIELSEKELGMGSELVSCMPGFIASIFDVICTQAKEHTDIPEEQIIDMVLHTMSATGDLMLQNKMAFDEVVTRVATKGGITEEGTKVVYEQFPDVVDALFEKTLAKRRSTAERAEQFFRE